MIQCKKSLSVLLALCVMFMSLAVLVIPAHAVDIYTNDQAYVRMAPYWTADVVEYLGVNHKIEQIIERDYNYLYVEYITSGITRRGYIPLDSTNATSYSWCSHSIFESGQYSGSGSRTVYYKPGGTNCGSIDSNEGQVDNKPLLVLREQGSYYFIQYCTNTSNTGSEHVKWKRGWIAKTSITILTKATSSNTSTGYYYLYNKASGRYLDLQGYSAGNVDGGNVHMWDFHGGYNQCWYIQPSQDTQPYTFYVKISTCQGYDNRVLRVSEKTAIKGNNIDIWTRVNGTAKEQEFYLKRDGTTDYYYIYSRCGANYMMLGVNPGDLGTGAEVYLNFPTNTDYNRWKLIPMYQGGVDYSYSSGGYIASTVANGINAKYDTTDMCRDKTVNGVVQHYTLHTQETFDNWNSYSNSLISLTADSTSDNKLIWSNATNVYMDELGHTHYTFGSTYPATATGNRSLVVYFGTIQQYVADKGYPDSDIIKIWKSTLAHELGHTLSLGHTDNTAALMSHGRNRRTVLGPQQMDIAGVKKNYAHK